MDNKYFNDTPILTPEEDRFGIDCFAKTLAHNIRDIKSPVGMAVAINGSWGSGKSSAVNLIRHYLKEEVKNGRISVIDFKCWWFKGEEALTLAFLQELNKALEKNLTDKAKGIIPRIGKSLLQGGAVIGPAVNLATSGLLGSLVSGSLDFAKRFFSEKESIESLFQQLTNELQKQNKRYLIVIDDIDRLAPPEALLIFRLVKSVGQLPNVVYLLIFDRELAEKNVKEQYPSEGPHFLEKIIQVCFELPLPARDDLNSAALSHIESMCGLPTDPERLRRFMNIFYDAIAPYINLPRDLTRLCNSIAMGWLSVAQEVDSADFVALEIMRLFEPRLYNEIRMNKDRVCGIRSTYRKQDDPEKEIQKFLNRVDEKNRDRARLMLLRLFPVFENVGYSSDFISVWESQRLVCTEKHFDTYFRMSIGDETLAVSEINEFIKYYSDKEYVKNTFREALKIIRKNGKSKVPLFLDELNVHALKIEKARFQSLISGLFEVADEINREEDKERGGFAIGDNHLRIHWLIRKLTFDRCNLEERDKIFLNAVKDAQLGWMVDFVSSATHDHYPRQGKSPQPPEKCLVKKESIENLKKHVLRAIRANAKTNELIRQSNLLYILFRWRDLAEDNSEEVKTWTSNALKDEKSLALLAKACTSETWSQSLGMFGLGDRVSIRTNRASVDGLNDIMDVEQFRRRLEEVKESVHLDEKEKDNIKVFLDAWERKESKVEE